MGVFGEIAGNEGFVGERRGSHIDAGLNTGRRGSHIEEIPRDPSRLHPSDNVIRRASINNPDFGGLTAEAKEATLAETTMSVRTGLKLYRKGIMWSLLLSTVRDLYLNFGVPEFGLRTDGCHRQLSWKATMSSYSPTFSG